MVQVNSRDRSGVCVRKKVTLYHSRLSGVEKGNRISIITGNIYVHTPRNEVIYIFTHVTKKDNAVSCYVAAVERIGTANSERFVMHLVSRVLWLETADASVKNFHAHLSLRCTTNFT